MAKYLFASISALAFGCGGGGGGGGGGGNPGLADTGVAAPDAQDTSRGGTPTDAAATPSPTDAVAPPPPDDAAAGPLPDAAPELGRLHLNEVSPSPSEGEDWFELIALDAPVDLSAWRIVDASAMREPAPLPAAILAAGERLRIFATSEAPADGAPWVPFKLGRGDTLSLSRSDGPGDAVAWEEGQVLHGQTWCRLPDGTGEWSSCRPTPGAPNEGAVPERPLFGTDRVVELRLELTPERWAAITADPLAEAWQAGDLVWDGQRLTDVDIRVKGNSSLNSVVRMRSRRYSFKVDLDDRVPGRSLQGEKKLNLNNGFKDPTLLRETLGYELMRAAGLPAPRTAFVDLWVAGEHMGLYTLVEEVDGGFVDEAFPDDGDGDLYKPEPPAGELRYQGDDPAAYRGLEIERNADTTDHAAFLALVRALNMGAPEDLPTVLDIDRALRYVAANALAVNLDSYLGTGHNYYLYEQEGVFSIIPWDLNEAFGNFNCGCDLPGLLDFRIDEPVCGGLGSRPLVARLLANPAHLATYHAHLRTLLEGPFAEADFRARVEALAGLIRPYVEADPTKFYSLADFDRGLTDDIVAGGFRAPGLIAFARGRAESVAAQLDGRRPATNGGQGGCGRAGPAQMHPCGNGECDEFERQNPNLCPRDCREAPPGGWCGDGICDALERDDLSCPEDCAR